MRCSRAAELAHSLSTCPQISTAAQIARTDAGSRGRGQKTPRDSSTDTHRINILRMITGENVRASRETRV